MTTERDNLSRDRRSDVGGKKVHLDFTRGATDALAGRSYRPIYSKNLDLYHAGYRWGLSFNACKEN